MDLASRKYARLSSYLTAAAAMAVGRARRRSPLPIKGRPWSRCRGLSPTSRRSLGPSSRPSSKERELFMQRSRRTTGSFYLLPRGERAAFPTGVWARWTMPHVFGSHFCSVVRPFHMVRHRVGSVSSRLVVGRLNAPCVLVFMRAVLLSMSAVFSAQFWFVLRVGMIKDLNGP